MQPRSMSWRWKTGTRKTTGRCGPRWRRFFRIKDLLGVNGRMMLELEAMTNQLGAMDNEAVYLQGFRDCVTLMKKIGAL